MAGPKAGRRTVKNLVKEFKLDRVKNANVIIDIMERLESSDVGTTLSAVTGLHHIFTFLLAEGAIERHSKQAGEGSASSAFNKWLRDMLEDTLAAFLKLLGHGERSVQQLALSSLVKLMQTEGRHPVRKTSPGGYRFPLKRLKAIVSALVSDAVDMRMLVNLFLEYLEFEDVRFYTLVAITDIIKARTHTDAHTNTHTFLNNLFPILEHIRIPTEGAAPPLSPPKLFLHPQDETEEENEGDFKDDRRKFTIPYAEARRCINVVWPWVLQCPLTPDLYRRALVTIPDLAMPHLDKPLALTGFFMESYNMGGAISLLALQGVFILINKHDLDYPDFYKKLYALLEPSVFHAKYRARFFMLCDRFLSSTHLPEYLAASFVKRLSRLSLVAPSPCLPLVIKFVVNLLIRFPGLQRLIHNPAVVVVEGGQPPSDPFQPAEPDPACTRASESSLWEIASLHHHSLPHISRLAGFTRRHSLPQREYNLGDCVEDGYVELFERATKTSLKESVPITFSRPQGLLQYPEDQMKDSWRVCEEEE